MNQDSDNSTMKQAAMEPIKVVVSEMIQLTDGEELLVTQANETFLHAIEMALRKTIEVQLAMIIKPKQVVLPVSAPMIPPTQLPKKRR